MERFKYLPNSNLVIQEKRFTLIIFIIGFLVSILLPIIIFNTIIKKVIFAAIFLILFECLFITIVSLYYDYICKKYRKEFWEFYNSIKDTININIPIDNLSQNDYFINIKKNCIIIDGTREYIPELMIFEQIKLSEMFMQNNNYEYRIYYGDYYDSEIDSICNDSIIIKAKRAH